MELEKEVERVLTLSVQRAGGLCLKWVCPGWAGVPDRICLFPGGRVVFVELKRSTGVVALRQQSWARRLRRLGFRAEIIKSKEEARSLAAEYSAKENVDTCVCCGEPIPEGRQVCPECERRGI